MPGSRLRMRSLQLRLHRLWDREDDSTLILWDSACCQDLEWWLALDRLELGISLDQVNLHLDFWSDTSDVGWGAHLLDLTASGLWSLEEVELSINARELLAVEKGLLHFAQLVSNSTVAVFSDNSTALAYLHKQWGDSVSNPQCHLSEDSPLGGDSRSCSSPSVYSGQEQCSNGLLVSSESSSGVRVDSQVGGVSSVEQEVAGDDRSFCHLVESPLFTLYFALPRSLIDR